MTADAASPPNVLIIGTGLIGASIGMALRESGVTVWLADTDTDACLLAASRGAGELFDSAKTPTSSWSLFHLMQFQTSQLAASRCTRTPRSPMLRASRPRRWPGYAGLRATRRGL